MNAHAKTIGILTEDFRLFYDLAETLKGMNVPFASLSFHHRVPQHVGVVLTSPSEVGKIRFDPIVPVEGDVRCGVRNALLLLYGKDRFDAIYIGVDPGEMPGLAVVADGQVLETERALSPEDAGAQILEMRIHYRADRVVVRVGHGDRENRNRILQIICRIVDRCEIVNEERTSMHPSTTDMESAIEIAMTGGYRVHAPPEVSPSPGKVRDVQRKSRIQSDGAVTLSKSEAEAVAKGDITMEEAVSRKRKGP